MFDSAWIQDKLCTNNARLIWDNHITRIAHSSIQQTAPLSVLYSPDDSSDTVQTSSSAAEAEPTQPHRQEPPTPTINTHTIQTGATFSTPGMLIVPAPPLCVMIDTISCVLFSSSYKLSGSVALRCIVDILGFVLLFVRHIHISSMGRLASSYIIVNKGLSHRVAGFGSSYRRRSSWNIWCGYGWGWDLFHSSHFAVGVPVWI